MATKINIEFYAEATDALLKALAELICISESSAGMGPVGLR